jgi:uncharacterized protein YbjT (DUF2867 family)
MDVVIAGGHGQVARRLARVLVERGDRVRGLIRKPEHADDLRADGSEPVLCDLESASTAELAQAVGGADAVVFAAGAGPGSGAERKATMDRDGAIKLLDAAVSAGVKRYVIVSSIGAESPPPEAEGDVFGAYLRAKAEADAAVVASDRDWTLVRPGSLTDEPGRGTARIQAEPIRESVSRDDVAAVLAAVLAEPRSAGLALYVVKGDESISEGLQRLLP